MLKNIKEILTNTGPRVFLRRINNSKISKKEITTCYFKSFGSLNSTKKFYIIRRFPTAGLFSNITFVLNHLKICDEMGLIPIIDMYNYPTLYNEYNNLNKTKNAWEYFFERLNNYTLEEVYKSKNVFLSSKKFEKNMSIDMNDHSISKYSKRIKIKKKIIKKKNKFIKEKFSKKYKILGVHFRGSTYKTARGHAFPATINLMIENIEFLVKKYNYKKIFVVTEEAFYLNALREKFKDKIIYYNSFRMRKLDSFKIYPRKKHRYFLGEEILVETLILSKCDGLTYVKSNVVSAAIMFSNKKIKLHEIFLGLNIRNKIFSKYLWFLKSKLPKKFGGLKMIYKNK